jgi:hypothetical protein
MARDAPIDPRQAQAARTHHPPAVAGAGRFVSAGERHRETFRCRDIEAHCTALRHDSYKHRQLGRRFGPLGQSCRFASVMLTIGNPQRRHS